MSKLSVLMKECQRNCDSTLYANKKELKKHLFQFLSLFNCCNLVVNETLFKTCFSLAVKSFTNYNRTYHRYFYFAVLIKEPTLFFLSNSLIFIYEHLIVDILGHIARFHTGMLTKNWCQKLQCPKCQQKNIFAIFVCFCNI
jgi:hypothetical protein